MKIQELFILADESLNTVVQQIDDALWDTELPPEFETRGDKRYTVREIVNYHAYDEAWVPDMVAGRTMNEVGEDAYQGDLLGADPKGSFATLVARGTEAVRALSDEDLSKTAHLSFGDFSVEDYLKQIAAFRGLRVHDLAKAVGQDPVMPDALVAGLYAMLVPIADEWRQYGVFGAAIDIRDDAAPQDRLLALTGRTPDHA